MDVIQKVADRHEPFEVFVRDGDAESVAIRCARGVTGSRTRRPTQRHIQVHRVMNGVSDRRPQHGVRDQQEPHAPPTTSSKLSNTSARGQKNQRGFGVSTRDTILKMSGRPRDKLPLINLR
jgi:hypothetical protein